MRSVYIIDGPVEYCRSNSGLKLGLYVGELYMHRSDVFTEN